MTTIIENVASQDLLSKLGVIAITFTLLYLGTLTVHRLYLSPIAHFPGPKLAALTYFYEIYYDVILGGQYTFQIGRLHERYGPVVRINPSELHVEDPDSYDVIYGVASSQRRNKSEVSTKGYGIPESMFGTAAHDLHKSRRAVLSSFFSKASVQKLEPMLRAKAKTLVSRLDEAKGSTAVVNLNHLFAAFSNDVVMQYAFGRCENRLEASSYDPSFHNASIMGAQMGIMLRYFPWMFPLMNSLPDSVAISMNPDMMSYINLQRGVFAQVAEIKSSSLSSEPPSHRTIFAEILSDSNSRTPASEKSVPRLAQEGTSSVAAGTISTSWTLTLGLYYILSNPSILGRLRTEIPPRASLDTMSASDLQQLPYLSAVIKESLRLSYGCSARLARVSPDQPMNLLINGITYTIPAGTPVGMSAALVHHNEKVFPDSNAFKPERWLGENPPDKYLVSFTKGSRQCIGMNLAKAELVLVFAYIIHLNVELYETSAEDVVMVSDWSIPIVKKGSKGVRIIVKDA